MKKIITGVLLASSFLVSAAEPEFTAQQLKQVAELRTNASNSDLSYQLLESLTTEIGPRLPGTENDKKAVAWAQEKFQALGFDKVWLEEALKALRHLKEDHSLVIDAAFSGANKGNLNYILDMFPCTTHRPLYFRSGSPSGSSLPFSEHIGKIRAKCTFLLSRVASFITSRRSLTLVMSQTPCFSNFSPSSRIAWRAFGLLCTSLLVSSLATMAL